MSPRREAELNVEMSGPVFWLFGLLRTSSFSVSLMDVFGVGSVSASASASATGLHVSHVCFLVMVIVTH